MLVSRECTYDTLFRGLRGGGGERSFRNPVTDAKKKKLKRCITRMIHCVAQDVLLVYFYVQLLNSDVQLRLFNLR